MTARRQKIYDINNATRVEYRRMRRIGFDRDESRLMVIGACVMQGEDVRCGTWTFKPQ